MSEQRKIAIVTDSSCDLSDEQLAEYGIRMVSLRMITSSAEYRDRVEITADALYALMQRELPRTSLPLSEDVGDLYDWFCAEGYTDIIHVSLSSGLSGTHNMVRMLAEDYEGRIRVHAVDSQTLSTGLGMIVLEVARAVRDGASPEEAVAIARRVRETQLGMFVIRTLEFLRKGGRIGLVEGVVGTLLQLKPVIFVNDDGVYQTLVKARGYQNAVDAMIREAVSRFGQNPVFLSVVHGQAAEDARALLQKLRGILNIRDAFIAPVSPVLAIHTGPGLLGIVAHRA